MHVSAHLLQGHAMHCAISCYVIIVVVVYVFIMSGEINMYALAQVLYSLQNNKKKYTQVGAKQFTISVNKQLANFLKHILCNYC